MLLKSAISFLCLGALLFNAAAGMERADLMPEGDGQLRVTGAEELKAHFLAAFGDRLLADSQFQGFSAGLKQKFEKKAEAGHWALEILYFTEVIKRLHGEILFTQSDEGYLCAAATQEEYALILERTDWVRRQFEDHLVRRREEFQDAELINDLFGGGTTNESALWISHEGSTLFISTDRSWVEQGLVELRKNGPAKEPAGSALALTIPVGAMIHAKINEAGPAQATAKKNMLEALGVWDLENYRATVSFEQDDLVFDGVLTAASLERGLFSLLHREPDEHTDNRVIPSGATSFSLGKLDLQQFWRELPAIVADLPAQQAMAVSGAIAVFQQQSGLNIEHDLIDHFGRRYCLSTGTIGTNETLALAWELTDGSALEQSIANLLTSPLLAKWAGAVATSEYRGHTLRLFNNGKSPGEGPAFCITPNWLVFGLKADLTRELLLQLDAPNAPAPSMLEQQARDLAPKKAFGFGAMNHQEAAGLLLNIRVSDSQFKAGLGFSSEPDSKDEDEELADGEISLNYLTSFIGHTYHSAEAVPGGLHHRLILENVNPKGAH